MIQVSNGAESKLKVFVSYSRADGEFVFAMCAALEARGIHPIIDTRDLPKLEDWRRELLGFIRESDAVIFVLSSHSVASPVCAWEVEQAASLNKRLAPVVLEHVSDELVPPALAKINYLDFIDSLSFEKQADVLASALSTDLGWIKEHTRLGEVSRRWDEDGHPNVRLLRGVDIDAAERWASRRPSSAPPLTEIMQHFIEESRRESNLQARHSRIRSLIVNGVSVAVALVIGSMGWFYYLQWQEGQRGLAQARFKQGQWTAREQQAEHAAGYFADAVKVDPGNEQARVALYNQLAENWHLFPHGRIEVGRPVRTVAYLDDGAGLIVTTESEVLLFRSDEDRAPALRLKHDEVVRHALMDPTGKQILTTATTFGSIVEAPYCVIRLWDAVTGQLLALKKLHGVATSSVFAPNGEIIVSTAFRPVVLSACLDRETVDLGASLDRERHRTRNVPTVLRLSSDGKRLLWGSGALAPAFYIWNLQNNKLQYKKTSSISFNDLRFVLNDTKVAIAGPDHTLLSGIGSPKVGYVAVQGPDDQKPNAAVQSSDALLSVAEVDPSGKFLMAAFEDKSVRTLVLPGNGALLDARQQAVISTARFSPDGLMIGAGDREGHVRIFDTLNLRPPSALRAQGGPITAIAFSRTSPRMASASEDGSIVVWDTATTVAKELILETGRPRMRETALLDEASSRLLMRSDGRVELWDALTGRQASEITLDTSKLRLAAVTGREGRALLVGDPQPVLLALGEGAITRLNADLPPGAIMGEFNMAGDRLVVVSKDMVQVLDSSTGASVLKIAKGESGDAFYAARFLDGGARLLVVRQSQLAIWDLNNRREIKSKKHSATRRASVFEDKQFVTKDEPLTAIDVKLAKDGDRFLVVFGYEGANVRAPAYRPNQVLTDAQLWSISAFEPLGAPIDADQEINSAMLSPSGRLVVAASESRAVFIAGKDGSPVRDTLMTDFPVFRSTISPDEDLVALHGRANDVLLVNLRDKTAPPRRLIHDGPVLFAAFLRGGSVLVSVAADGRARLWDVHEGTVIGSEIIVGRCDEAKLAMNDELLVTHLAAGVVVIRRLQMPVLSAEELASFRELGERIVGMRVVDRGNLAALVVRDASSPELPEASRGLLGWFSQAPAGRTVFPGAQLTRAEVINRYADGQVDNLSVLMTLLQQSPNNPQLLMRMADTVERSPENDALMGLARLWKQVAEEAHQPDKP